MAYLKFFFLSFLLGACYSVSKPQAADDYVGEYSNYDSRVTYLLTLKDDGYFFYLSGIGLLSVSYSGTWSIAPNGKAILLRIDDICATPYYRVDSIENNKTTINAFWCGTDEEVEVQYKLYDNGVVVTDTVGLGSYEVGDNIDSLVAFFVWNEPFVIDIKANWHSQIQLYLRYADRLNDRPLFDKPVRIRGNSLKLPNGVKLTRKEK